METYKDSIPENTGEIVVYQPDDITRLEEISVCSILERTASDGKTYMTQFYNLDMILSVGKTTQRT